MTDRVALLRGFPESSMAIDESIYVDADQYRSFCEAIVSCVGVGVMVVSLDGDHLLVNAEMRRLMAVGFPQSHSGAAGEVGEVYAPDGETRLEAQDLPSSRAMRGEAYTNLRVVLGAHGGPRLAVSLTARSLRAHSGDGLGSVVVATDTTDLSAALDAKDRFVANVSHDLRTPLTSIIGYLALVLDESDDISAETRTHLAIAQRNSERLLGLINGLLHPATMGTASALSRAPTDLGQLLEHAVESARPLAETAGLQLTLSAGPTQPISVDGARISEVFDNLLANALKFTPPGGRVSVRLESDGGQILVFFSDSGPGVDTADQGMIFERFARSSYAEENAIPGVGLGLNIARDTVHAHGGQIRVQAAPEGGAEFVVQLPV